LDNKKVDADGRRLKEAFWDQEIVHDRIIAKKLADVSAVKQLEKGEHLYTEKEARKNVPFFVLMGNLRLSTRRRHVYDLKPKEIVGEFPILVHEQKQFTLFRQGTRNKYCCRSGRRQIS
jgi:hypothetical protein